MFEDIFDKDMFDFDDKEPEEVSNTEKDTGVWDTGKKEDVWRAGGGSSNADPNDVWSVDPAKDPKPTHGPLSNNPTTEKTPDPATPYPAYDEGDGLDEYGDIEDDMDIANSPGLLNHRGSRFRY